MWLYYCLLSTIISGFTSIAMKKCSDKEPKRIALAGLIFYHFIMIFTNLVLNPEIFLNININDMIKMLPGIVM